MSLQCILLLLNILVSCNARYPSNSCYKYENHAAKYKLRHDKQGYPEEKIRLVLGQHPEMRSMFYPDENYISAPVNPLVKPVSTACPYNRYTLYGFYYGTEDCWVIYPNIQRVSYVECSSRYQHNCLSCTPRTGVSKCDEDYEYRNVWAYCNYNSPAYTPKRYYYAPKSQREVYGPSNVHPKTHVDYHPSSQGTAYYGAGSEYNPNIGGLVHGAKTIHYNEPKETHYDNIPEHRDIPEYRDLTEYRSHPEQKQKYHHVPGSKQPIIYAEKVYYTEPQKEKKSSIFDVEPFGFHSDFFTKSRLRLPISEPEPEPKPHPDSLFDSISSHDGWGSAHKPPSHHRWKRSSRTGQRKNGEIKRLKLYLPFHCGCKTYSC